MNQELVVIYDPSSPVGFAMGQFRYALVPEPSSALLLVLALATGYALQRWPSRRRSAD
jgi:hypothetical protein